RGLFKLLYLGRELLSLRKNRRTILGARLPDRARESFLLGARLFSHLQGGAARLVGCKEVIYESFISAAGPLRGLHRLGVVANIANIDHVSSLARDCILSI